MLSFKEFCNEQELNEKKLTKEYIDEVLKKLGIKNYQINSDMTVDINKQKEKEGENVIQMPIKIGNIFGIFWNYIEDMSKFNGYVNNRD